MSQIFAGVDALKLPYTHMLDEEVEETLEILWEIVCVEPLFGVLKNLQANCMEDLFVHSQ